MKLSERKICKIVLYLLLTVFKFRIIPSIINTSSAPRQTLLHSRHLSLSETENSRCGEWHWLAIDAAAISPMLMPSRYNVHCWTSLLSSHGRGPPCNFNIISRIIRPFTEKWIQYTWYIPPNTTYIRLRNFSYGLGCNLSLWLLCWWPVKFIWIRLGLIESYRLRQYSHLWQQQNTRAA